MPHVLLITDKDRQPDAAHENRSEIDTHSVAEVEVNRRIRCTSRCLTRGFDRHLRSGGKDASLELGENTVKTLRQCSIFQEEAPVTFFVIFDRVETDPALAVAHRQYAVSHLREDNGRKRQLGLTA